MSSTADRSNGRILRNYIYANISLHKLAKILIEDWQINAFIDILDTKYYWYILL